MNGYAFIETISSILNQSERVVFNKGAFYLLGAAIGLMDLIFIMIYQGVWKKPLTAGITKWFSRVALASLLLALLLPTISHLVISRTVEAMGYEVCVAESNSWLYMSEIIYAKDGIACSSR